MNTQVVLKTKFPSLPSDWDVGTSFKKHTALSKCKDATIEPAGRWYEAYANRRRRGRTLSQDEEEALAAHLAEAELGAESEGEDEMIDDVDGNDFKGIDPADWKENDQYKILGLGRLRYKANDEQIKQAYRKACLAHHPDKKARLTNGMDDDAIFKGIKLAYDTLTAPARRRAWDSVDPTFDDSFPAQKKGLSAKEFIKRYSKVVEDNSRFSTKQPVPGLGLVEATRAEVEAFYNFWYDFDSWREFSWNDKEDVSSADISRDERRYRDKKNVAARKKAKKEDNQRMTKLVDAIFHSDPRLAEIKAKEKAEKNKGANAKAAQLAKEKEEARIAKEAADIQAAKEAEAAKSAAGDKKKSKEAAKNKIKKARQAVRKACKENNYYMPEGTSLDETEERMSHMELLCSKLTVDELEALVANGLDGESFAKAVESQGATAKRFAHVPVVHVADEYTKSKSIAHEWTEKEDELLVKAVKVFPPGTRQRWQTIADYINARDGNVTGDDVMNKTKAEKVGGKKNVDAFEAFEKKGHKPIEELHSMGGISQRYDDDDEKTDEWTTEQQKALEAGISTYKELSKEEGKWDRIADMVEGKDAKHCVARIKAIKKAMKAKM